MLVIATTFLQLSDHCSVSFSLLLTPSHVLFISIPKHPFCSWVLDHLYSHYPELSWVDCLSPLHFILLLELYIVPSFGTCSSVTSFCLNPSFCFSFVPLFVWYIGFVSTLEKRLFWEALYGSQKHTTLISKVICSRGSPCECCMALSIMTNYSGSLIGLAGFQSTWLPGPSLREGYQLLVGGTQSTGSWLWNPSVLGLVLGSVSPVQFSCSVVSNSLRPRGLQHASARLLVVKDRVQDTQGLLSYFGGWNQPRVAASTLAVRTSSWGLVAEPMGHRVGVKSLVWWGWFTKELESVLKLMLVCWFIGPEPNTSQGRFWPAHEQVQSTD